MTNRLPARVVAIVVALALFVAPLTTARAQPRRAEAHKGEAKGEARDLYVKAMRHYELGEYDPAIEDFKKAYELSQAPGLLFNLGQVYRLKKDWAQALRLYRSYVRLVPQAKNRADVESMIVEMQANLDEEQRAAAAAAAAATAAQQAAATGPTPSAGQPAATTVTAPAIVAAPITPPPPAPPRHGKAKLWAGGALVVVGLGALGAGIGLGFRARSDSRQLVDAANEGSQTWDGSRQALYRDGQHMAVAATTLDVVGGALVAAGVVVGILGIRDVRHARHFAFMPSLHGAGVTCAF